MLTCLDENMHRFVPKMGKPLKSGCVPFTGANNNGYGLFSWRHQLGEDCRTLGAHVASYRLFKGEVPEGMLVMHKCNNRRCVNPDHLEAGTQKQNMEHCIASGRIARGHNQGLAVMTWPRVRKLRRLYDKGFTQVQLAAMFAISQPTVSQIVRGTTWKEAA